MREGLLASGELGPGYAPQMEDVHRKNAARLRELIAMYGWPAEDIAAKDGAEAAWLIAQHAIGKPEFQRNALKLLEACATEGRVPACQAAYLEDRVAMYEGRPQRYGTQWMDDHKDGRIRPWALADPNRVNELRAQVGLEPMRQIPKPGPDLSAEERQKIEEKERGWQVWLVQKGWRRQS